MEVIAEEDHVVLVVVLGLNIPAGTGQIMKVPSGFLRIPMGRDPAIEHGTKLKEAGEAIEEKKESDLVVASSLEGVDRAAQMDQQLRHQKI